MSRREWPKADGWAVIKNGKINVRTVSDTRRASLVNWLVTDGGVLVTAAWTDEMIEAAWGRLSPGDAVCTTVNIEQTLPTL